MNELFQPNKINDLFMFPVFPQKSGKAVDKGNHKPVEKPGENPGTRALVGKSEFSAQVMHLLQTSHTPFADKLILRHKPRRAMAGGAFPQPYGVLNKSY